MHAGFLLIDKPADWTSHDVVAYLRRVTGIKKIGHAGTLDPFATGLLIVGIGREATKRLDEFKSLKKEYIATIRLGATSDTQDSTGNIQISSDKFQKKFKREEIETILKSFTGKIQQVPPMFSAKKIGGKKLYELARKGEEIARKAAEVEVFEIELLEYLENLLKLRIICSPGTYIRTLAADIGEKLGVGGYCEKLRRTKIGSYSVEDAKKYLFNLP